MTPVVLYFKLVALPDQENPGIYTKRPHHGNLEMGPESYMQIADSGVRSEALEVSENLSAHLALNWNPKYGEIGPQLREK